MTDLLPVGKAAPLFSLLDQTGEKVALKDFRGSKNIVLYFYPRAMTPGCTVQACGIRDAKRSLSAQDTVVLAISPDQPEKLKAFEKKEGLNFTLLSDPDHKIALKYGAWGPKKFMGRAFDGILRTTFVIGKDGKIKHVIAKVNTKTHHTDVLKLLKEIES